MKPGKNYGVSELIAYLSLTAILTGIVVYFFIPSKQDISIEDNTITTEDKPNKIVYKTIEEYIFKGVEKAGFTPPKDFVRVEINGIPVNVAPSRASAPIHIYTKSDWNSGIEDDMQTFYLQFENPMFSLEEANIAKREFWSGPFYGNLKSLIQ